MPMCHAVAGIYRSLCHHPRAPRIKQGFLLHYISFIRALLPSFLQRAVERVVENVAQREQADEVAALVDHDEAVHARFTDRVEDGVEAVVERAGVDAGEVLRERS